MRRVRGVFVNWCINEIDSDAEQLAVLLTHYRKLGQQVKRVFNRLAHTSSDRHERWHQACLRVLGPDYFSLGNQIVSAVGLYCVALYLRFQAKLVAMSSLRSLRGISTLPDLVKRYPALKKASSYKKVHELWLVYKASVDGRNSPAAKQLKVLRPAYLEEYKNVEIEGRKSHLISLVFGNLAIVEKDFARYASALKDFAKVIQRQLPIP